MSGTVPAGAADWVWANSTLTDPNYNYVSQVKVAEYQSTTIGTPALAYVAFNYPISYPHTIYVRAKIGGTVTTLASYTTTQSILSLIHI